jgi:hypothetical protein
MTRLATLSVLAAALLAGCARPPARVPPAGESMTVRGVLATGVECPEIHTRDGRRFALGGSLGGYSAGDEVCVRGRVVAMSICMAGEATLAIESIGPPGDCQ